VKNPTELWVYLAASPLLWLCLTLFTWIAANKLSKWLNRNPLANPVLLSIIVLGLLLKISNTNYGQFFSGAQFIHFLLGPATVALAVPLHRQWANVRRLAWPLFISLMVGSITSVLSVVALGKVFDLKSEILLSFLPKSATAGVAMSISASLGGNPSLTAVLVILTGIFGAVTVTPLMNLMGVTNYAARGFAAGLASHGIGTARAYNVDATAGLFAGIAMSLNAIATTVVVPMVVHIGGF
jgi:predicted murein hydrolase (TIGR00659 family)